jgi:hypothetical protein
MSSFMLLRVLKYDHDININMKIWRGRRVKGIGDEEEWRPIAERNNQLMRIAMIG